MEEKESAEGNFSKPEETPVAKTIPKKVMEEYEKKANPELKKFGKKIVNKNRHDLLLYGVVILAAFVLVFGYMALNDKFKTNVECPEINISIPACPSFSCPDLTCPTNNVSLSCGNVTFPDNLNINLENNSNG